MCPVVNSSLPFTTSGEDLSYCQTNCCIMSY